MSLFLVLVLVLVIATGLLAWRFGGPPERIGAAIIVGWAALDFFYHLVLGASDFSKVDPVHVLLDGSELVAIVWLALRANRLWPLVAAAAQLICIMGHVAALMETEGMRRAYWAATQIPPFFQMIALLAGTIAHARRTRRIGPYRSWRYT